LQSPAEKEVDLYISPFTKTILMSIKFLFTAIGLLFVLASRAQSSISGTVKNEEKGEPLPGVSVLIKKTETGTVTDNKGNYLLKNFPSGKLALSFSYTGFENFDTTFTPGKNDKIILDISLRPEKEELDEVVIISSSRTNSRIEDLPTKVEVLGSEEVGEENQIQPGNIVSLLSDIAGVQVQQTNAATGNADLRIQGLQGKYTQILRDGLPLFAGYSGSFNILQIPPLDLQQIELIKGASSTLYGGGAIAGMVNLISKKPKMGSPERSITLNTTTLKENNFTSFFSGANKNAGYTLYAGGTLQKPADVNNDGFSDVPDVKSAFIHPRFFWYASPKSAFILGYTINYEYRNGGDMQVLNGNKNAAHPFFIENQSMRNTVDFDWDKTFNNGGSLTAKGSSSFFNRDITTNLFGMKGNQTIWYTELAYAKKSGRHNFVFGMNFTGTDFKKKLPDSTLLPNEANNTTGFFTQDDWKFADKFTLQAGLRYDHNSDYGGFLLPRLSLMYKASSKVTMRLGGGFGYKNSELFDDEIDDRDYRYISGFVPDIQSEKSAGANFDVNYKIKADEWNLTFNQTFFYNNISKAILLDSTSNFTDFKYYNANGAIQTYGSETYIQAKQDELELYFDYLYTNAQRKYDPANVNLPLIARNKLAAIVSYEFSNAFRAGIDCSYIGKQYLDNGSGTQPYLLLAPMAGYTIKQKISLVLNCENLLDYRQNKHNQVVFPPYNNPSFPEIWAPMDGRVANLSVRWKF
jgi:iron complex outermembrane receptor protein/outer membrane receptor for ferrienterochelin and colicins